MNPQQRLSLSADVLRSLYEMRDRRISLDDLADALGASVIPTRDGVRPRAVRREDVREIVRRLDEEGFVDAARMRLTLQGFALAASLTERRLVPLHLVA
jgi:DNA-binding Lrp family transcriptional regulator